MPSLVGHEEDAALYPKGSGKVLKGLRTPEQMCILWLGMTQIRSHSAILGTRVVQSQAMISVQLSLSYTLDIIYLFTPKV